jgi:linear primary-alkylsulfatase
LDGTESIPKLIPPSSAIIAAAPATFVNYHRVRIDPKKAETVDKVLAITFGDKTVALHVRRVIAEFVPDLGKYYRKSDITLAMGGAQWAVTIGNAQA